MSITETTTSTSFGPESIRPRSSHGWKTRVAMVVAAVAMLLIPASVAAAQGYGTADGPKVSDATPAPGAKITVEFSGFAPNIDVTLEFHSDPVKLGTFKSDAAGVVKATISVPDGVTGNHTVVASGLSVAGQPVTVSVPVAVSPAKAGAGLLALTGADSRSMVALGTILLIVGAAATLAARKRMADQS